MSISPRTRLRGNSSVRPQPPHLTVARPSSLNSSTLMASFPHLGHRKTLGNRFLGMRTTFLRLLPIFRPLSLNFFTLAVLPMPKYITIAHILPIVLTHVKKENSQLHFPFFPQKLRTLVHWALAPILIPHQNYSQLNLHSDFRKNEL